MGDASSFLRSTFVVSCGLLVVAACGDDGAMDTPAVDGGSQGTPDAAVADGGEAHGHGSDAASGAGDASAPDPTCTATISLQDFKLVPDKPTAKAGPVVLCARNDGKAPHDLGLRGADMQTLQKTATLGPGESARITLTLATGSFAIFCSQGGHESLGMKGTLTVD